MSAATPLLPPADYPSRARVQQQVNHLTELGGRVVGEFLDELGRREGVTAAIRRQLETYSRITRDMVVTTGADRWAPSPTRIIRQGDQ
jgi:hypothetical protein